VKRRWPNRTKVLKIQTIVSAADAEPHFKLTQYTAQSAVHLFHLHFFNRHILIPPNHRTGESKDVSGEFKEEQNDPAGRVQESERLYLPPY